jgi:hypothetical protein
MKQPNGTPGTVSKILWHFTGGPVWDSEKQCQRLRPKDAGAAYTALVSIVRTSTLRLGQYHEMVKARYTVPVRDGKGKETRRETREVTFQSAPVCCLADIPIAHLAYHSHRYGKFAIGFHRDAIVRHRFSPVFYALHDAAPVQSLRRSISSIESMAEDVAFKAGDVERFASDARCEDGHPIEDAGSALSDFEWAFESIYESAKTARAELREAIAFVKTFSQAQFSTVYCEREWRSTREFGFRLEDVAMIVLPRTTDNQCYFEAFLSQFKETLPRSIPVVPWDDLVEH